MNPCRYLLLLGLLAWIICVIACAGGGTTPGGTGRELGQRGSETREVAAASPAERWAASVKEQRAARIERLQDEVAGAEADAARLHSELDDTKKKLKRVSLAKDERALKVKQVEQSQKHSEASQKLKTLKEDLKAADTWEPRVMPADLRTGMLTKLGTATATPVFQVFQIIDRSTLLAEFDGRHYWVEGLGTGNLADGDRITLKGVVECPGNRQYTTPLGTTKTVMVIKVLASE